MTRSSEAVPDWAIFPKRTHSVAAEYHSGTVLEIVRRMQNHLRSLLQSLHDLRLRGVAMSDFHGKNTSPPILNHKRIPVLPHAKKCARRDLQNARTLPNHNPRVYAVTVSEAVGRID